MTLWTEGDRHPIDGEPFYRVGEPGEMTLNGCCTPVFTADMAKEDEGPLFYVETSRKTELAAQLLGVTVQELEAMLLWLKG